MENKNELALKPPETKDEKEALEKYEQRNKSDYEFDIESQIRYLLSVTNNSKDNKYSETLSLDSNGEILNKNYETNNVGVSILHRIKGVNFDRKGLDKIIKDINNKNRNLKFTLNESDNTLTITVENLVKKHAFALWTTAGGTLMFEQPRRIVYVSDDGQYAFFDGTMTGIPTAELEITR